MMKRFDIQKILPISAMAILFAGSIILPIEPSGVKRAVENNSESNTLKAINNTKSKKQAENPFKEINLLSKSAIVFDIKNSKSLFELNPDQVLPLASVTKMLLAPVAFDILPKQTEILIQKSFLEAEGDSGLLVDERWVLGDLVSFSLTVSSNDGARAIASVAGAKYLNTDNTDIGREEFVRLMNKKALEFGMEKTLIKNETGLDEDKDISGAYSTSREVAILFEKLLSKYPELVRTTSSKTSAFRSLSGIDHIVKNTNLITDNIPGLMISKTGFTDLAGGNLAIMFDAGIGRPIIVVVLGSTTQGRFEDVQKLVGATEKFLLQEKNIIK